MRTIVLSAWLLAAGVASAQVEIHGGATAQGGGTASFLNGATAPSNTIGSDGDWYLDTSAYCLYGPKAAGAWPATCVSLIGPAGPQGPPGTSGNVSFSGVGGGTNSNALLVSGTLDPTAGGSINANKLGGVLLSGLATGLLKNSAGSPGIAGSSDIAAALTFTPENAGNKGAAGGYASLDASAKVPAAQIPAMTAVNGTTVPANAAADQTLVTTATATGSWAALPSCPDSGGNHLNYSTSTHGFVCGTTGSTTFSGVGGGTNANALLVSGSLDYSGSGWIDANKIMGAGISGLSGLIKFTAGVPSVAAAADINAALTYTPENPINKGAAGGYASLDASAKVPAAQIPAITAVNGTTVPANSAADQTLVTTATATGSWAALPSCPDSGGNHLNYSTSTHGFVCGTTGGTGSVTFSGVGGGTNANALLVSGSLDYSGSGWIDANKIMGAGISGLSGLIKFTAGVPSVAAAGDVTTALGYTPISGPGTATNGYLATWGASNSQLTGGLPVSTAAAANTVPQSGAGGKLAQTWIDFTGYQTAISGAPATWPTLGGAALLNVGTTSGTVAAGDDSRIASAVTNTSLSNNTLPGGFTVLGTTGDANVGGNLNATGNISSGSSGVGVATANYTSGPASGWGNATCTFTVLGGGAGASGAVFNLAVTGSQPAAGTPLNQVTGGTGYTALPASATISGAGCPSGTATISTTLTPATLHMADGSLHDNVLAAPKAGGNWLWTLPSNGTGCSGAACGALLGANNNLKDLPNASGGASSTPAGNTIPVAGGNGRLAQGFIPVPQYAAWLRYFGDGSEGAGTCNNASLGGEHWYTTFNVDAGNTCTNNAVDTPLVIRATGACTVAGTINARGVDGGVNAYGAVSGGGGGGGGTSAATSKGYGALSVYNTITGGNAGAASGGAGGNGGTASTAQQKIALENLGPYVGGAMGSQGGNSGGAGGFGGSTVVLVCNSISFTGTINVSGANGTNAAANSTGAGGGGGGGFVVLSATTYPSNTGTATLAGGTGGSCGSYTTCGTGGNGGTGYYVALTIQ